VIEERNFRLLPAAAAAAAATAFGRRLARGESARIL